MLNMRVIRFVVLAALLLAASLGSAKAQLAYTTAVANNGSTATVVNKLAIMSSGTFTVATTGSTTGVWGIVIAGAGTSGNPTVVSNGVAYCAFDGTPTAGDYVQASTSSGGECHDAGSTEPTSGDIIGKAISATAVSGNYPVAVNITPAPGGGTGTVMSVTCNAGLSGGTFTTSGTCALDPTHANNFSGAQQFAEAHGTAYAPTLTTNNYNAAITDCGKTLLLPTGTTPTVTLPNINPTNGECSIKMVQTTAGTSLYTIQAASGGTLVSANSYTHTAKQYATIVATLIVPSGSAATWSLSGEGS